MAESTELEETLEALRGLAHRRFGKIPADVLAKQVVARSAGADWPVREAAMEALLRRYRFAQRDELVVAASPTRGVLGTYKTARRTSGKGKRGERPYTTLLTSLVPLDGSCDCADFLRSSLGVCKHLLAILDHVYAKAKGGAVSGTKPPQAAALRWIPDLPLGGPLDRLSGLRWAIRPGPRPRGWVEAPGGKGLAIERRVLQDLARRTDVLRTLAAMGRTNAEPAARALVVEELERAQRQIELHRVAARAASHLKSLGRTLYPYQRDGVMGFLQAGRLLLADDMGLGKTTQAIAACHALHREGSVRKGLLIVPASLKSQWLREWQDTTDVPAAIVEGTPAERARQYRELRSGFLILGYEQLLKDFLLVQHLAADIVVLDEAQRIKNWATKSAAYVKALTPRYRLVLTGTPMENRLEELASVLDWVDDVALAPKWRLDAWHTTDEGDG
ncbi:MAG TPA: SNF2-related protein, partial [Polyangiaceae bacterium]